MLKLVNIIVSVTKRKYKECRNCLTRGTPTCIISISGQIKKQVCFQLHARIAFWLQNLHAAFFFFYDDVCIQKSLKCRRNMLQNDFLTWTCLRHRLQCLFVKSNIWVYFWLINIKKDTTPTHIIVSVCISSCSVDKKDCALLFLSRWNYK